MKTTSMTLALCALLLAGACSNDGQSSATAGTPANEPAASQAQQASLTPEQLGELGAQITKSPSDAQRLLSQRGLSEEKFEQAVRKVSEDPAAAKRYRESYKKASA